MNEATIDSPSNERIKRLVRLRDRGNRDTEGVFVVEGHRMIELAIHKGVALRELYVTPDHPLAGHGAAITVARHALDKASYRDRSQGVIAVFEQMRTGFDVLTSLDRALVIVVENVEKPGNLGAILRTADAVSATGVIAIGNSVDLYNPNVLRSSTGAVFTVPFATADLETLRIWLDRHGIQLVVATPDARTPFWDAPFTRSIAILVGAEDSGVSPTTIEAATRVVSIPMDGDVDSLNVSVSAALLAFEAKRQRSAQGH